MLRIAMMAILTIACGCSSIRQHAQNESLCKAVQMLNSSRCPGFSGFPTLDDDNASSDRLLFDITFLQPVESAQLNVWATHATRPQWSRDALDSARSEYSDAHKSAHGVRPDLWYVMSCTVEQLRKMSDDLYEVANENYSFEMQEIEDDISLYNEIQDEKNGTKWDAATDILEGIKPQTNIIYQP
jgi:hypothetical protein